MLGVPLGLLVHRIVMPITGHAAGIDLPASFLAVWSVPTLILPALAGVVIAALGALVPARSAARLTIAEALRTE